MATVFPRCIELYFHQNKKQKRVGLQVENDAIDLIDDHQL